MADVRIVPAQAVEVVDLLDELTAELATQGYGAEGTFGYSVQQLQDGGVHLVAAHVDGSPAGVGGVELSPDGTAELKRMYVRPVHRGAGVADAIVRALLRYAVEQGAWVVRLETGDQQHAALAFYARHGFERVPRFGPYVDSPTSVCMQRTTGDPRPTEG